MPPRAILRTLCCALVASATFAALPVLAAEEKPNILFILADNVGFGDLGVYGGGELRGAPTPHIDQLAAESLRLTQFLVEPGCTPSRAALMTGRYSIRSGLSLVAVAGSSISLPASEITMAEMLREAGYATAMFGKWHLGAQPYSQPQRKGFDEFYGIPPGDTWDAFLMIPQGRQTKTLEIPLDKGPQIVEAQRGEPLTNVKPYTAEVRRDIDWELVDRGVDFMQRQKAAGKPFFLYLPISRAHFPNLPSKRFEGQSRIGQFGDSLIEGDAIVGKVLDSLKSLGLDAKYHRRLRFRQRPAGRCGTVSPPPLSLSRQRIQAELWVVPLHRRAPGCIRLRRRTQKITTERSSRFCRAHQRFPVLAHKGHAARTWVR